MRASHSFSVHCEWIEQFTQERMEKSRVVKSRVMVTLQFFLLRIVVRPVSGVGGFCVDSLYCFALIEPIKIVSRMQHTAGATVA